MTPEEMERAIEILLNNQARHELHLERTDQQIVQTNQQIGILAESQREFTQVVLQYIESQGEFNKSIRDSIRDLSNTVERYINEGRNGKS
jgi:inactivated superfamily I helicase